MTINKISNEVFQLSFKKFGSCVYLLKLKNNKNILIDTSSKDNESELVEDLQKLNLKPKDINIILLTHSHYDHVGNLDLFQSAKVYDINNIEKFKIKDIKVIKTPGHAQDSLCFLYKDILFSGDTLFYNGIGRTDLPDSEPKKMQESLGRLKRLNYKILCPGHID